MVYLIVRSYYSIKCDECGWVNLVERGGDIYNKAQAVRSLGWSYGRDKSVHCSSCRWDNHRARVR